LPKNKPVVFPGGLGVADAVDKFAWIEDEDGNPYGTQALNKSNLE
jgi:hypothetical protein